MVIQLSLLRKLWTSALAGQLCREPFTDRSLVCLFYFACYTMQWARLPAERVNFCYKLKRFVHIFFFSFSSPLSV